MKYKKIRLGATSALMVSAMLISDSAAVIAVYFLAAVWHELGHWLAARRLGVGIKEIRFDYSGVRMVTDDVLTSYRQEAILAAAGPLFNLLAVALVTLICGLVGEKELFLTAESFLVGDDTCFSGGFAFFALASLTQAVTNLLPVGDFDGGRILFCLLAPPLGEKWARRLCGIASAVSAFVLWTVALYLMLRVSAGLGVYAFAACVFFGTVGKEELKF